MKLIIGLGNPGPEYAKTRHNLGYMAVDAKAEALKADWKLWGQGKRCELAQVSVGDEKVIFQKPLTFMNLSGHAAVEAAHFFKILPEDICVIHDELDLPFGDVRLKVGGGEGGHNGLKSLTQSLATGKYARIRMGIGRPPNVNVSSHDFVLNAFGSADWTTVDDMVERALRAIDAFIEGPNRFLREMNDLNRKKKD